MLNRPAIVPGRGWWSGAAASHTGLAAAGRDGREQAALRVAQCPHGPQEAPGSTRPPFPSFLINIH